MNKYYIYICQGDYGNHAVEARTGFEWEGESPTDAVQRLQDSYPYYTNDLFIVVEVNQDGDVSRDITGVRVSNGGRAYVEHLGR